MLGNRGGSTNYIGNVDWLSTAPSFRSRFAARDCLRVSLQGCLKVRGRESRTCQNPDPPGKMRKNEIIKPTKIKAHVESHRWSVFRFNEYLPLSSLTADDSVSFKVVPAQTVDATLACSLAAGVWNPRFFLTTTERFDLASLRKCQIHCAGSWAEDWFRT